MRVIICGAGIAGLSLAWWLARDGWDVLIVERAPGLRDEGALQALQALHLNSGLNLNYKV